MLLRRVRSRRRCRLADRVSSLRLLNLYRRRPDRQLNPLRPQAGRHLRQSLRTNRFLLLPGRNRSPRSRHRSRLLLRPVRTTGRLHHLTGRTTSQLRGRRGLMQGRQRHRTGRMRGLRLRLQGRMRDRLHRRTGRTRIQRLRPKSPQPSRLPSLRTRTRSLTTKTRSPSRRIGIATDWKGRGVRAAALAFFGGDAEGVRNGDL